MWFIIFAYVLLIYISLPYARVVLNEIYAVAGIRFLNYLFLFLSFVIFVLFIYLFRQKGRYLCLALFLSFFILVGANLFLKFPEERIHFIEYALLGSFVFFACKNTSFFEKYVIFFSMILVFIFGALEEIIQYFLPNRVGDVRDVVMNFVGGIWGVLLAKFYSS